MSTGRQSTSHCPHHLSITYPYHTIHITLSHHSIHSILSPRLLYYSSILSLFCVFCAYSAYSTSICVRILSIQSVVQRCRSFTGLLVHFLAGNYHGLAVPPVACIWASPTGPATATSLAPARQRRRVGFHGIAKTRRSPLRGQLAVRGAAGGVGELRVYPIFYSCYCTADPISNPWIVQKYK